MKLAAVHEIATTRVAVMGLSGVGKSTLVSKLANDGYILHWISLDNDKDILFKLPKESWDNVDYIELPDSATFPVAADSLMKLFKNGSANFCYDHGVDGCQVCKKDKPESFSHIDFSKFDPKKDILVIDTGSQLGHSILSHTLKDEPIEYKPERDDWGALRKWTEFFFSQWQAARFNLIVVFHSIEAKMEDNRTKMVPAFGSRDMSSKVAGCFSHVVYLDVVNGKHVAYSASTYSNNVLTKSRTDFVIESLNQPSLLPIFTGVIPETMLKKEDPPTSDVDPGKAASKLEELRSKLMKGKK